MSQASKSFGNNLDFRITLGTSTASTSNWKDISDWVMSVDGLPGEREMADVTCGGGANSHQYLAGMYTAEISLSCLFDQSSGSAYDVLSGFQTDRYHRHFAYYPAGATTDYPMIHGQCQVKSLVLTAKPLEPLSFTATIVVDSSMSVTICAT